MSVQEGTSEDVTLLIESVVAVLEMVKNPVSYCKTDTGVLSAMKCARQVEDMYQELRAKRLHLLFIQKLCKTLQVQEELYNESKIQYACDSIVEAMLTSNTVPSSCLLCCLNNYIEVCGKERFTQLLSGVVVKSEACRVLLDYIGTLENGTQTNLIFQANVFLRVLTSKGTESAVIHSIHHWLASDGEYRVAVVFQAISEAEPSSRLSKALIQGLVSVLDDRTRTAALYLSAVLSSPVSLTILKNSKSLFYASLDFLTKCAANFKLTPDLAWRSCENGPCQTITYDMIVKYIYFLKSDNELATLVDTFLRESCTLPGCTFWEDIIESFPT